MVPRTADVLGDAPSFGDLLLPDDIVQSLTDVGFIRPSPVQQAAIPLARFGADVIIQAKAGTGKTLVFAIAAVERIDTTNAFPQALVLAPTREVALQAAEVVADAAGMRSVTVATFIGGLPTMEDEKVLRRTCHIIVGTPGRVLALIQRGTLVTNKIRMLVLDEADKLLSEAFLNDVHMVIGEIPLGRQVLAVSATYTDTSLSKLKSIMHKPHEVRLVGGDASLLGVKHFYREIVVSQVTTSYAARRAALLDILSSVSFHQAVVFCNRKAIADDLADDLAAAGHSAACLSSAKEQLERIQIINALRTFQLRVVVSTDVAARGVDLDKVTLVINFDLPEDSATLMHRIGRAGRFGTRGIAISLVTTGGGLGGKGELNTALASVSGGKVSPLPDIIPSDWNASYGASSSVREGDGNETEEHVIHVAPAVPGDMDDSRVLGMGLASSHKAATEGGNLLDSSIKDSRRREVDAILHASLWPEDRGPLKKTDVWPLQLSDVAVLLPPTTPAAGSISIQAASPSLPTDLDAQSDSAVGVDSELIDLSHSVLPSTRIAANAVQEGHFREVARSAALDLERSIESTKEAKKVLGAAFKRIIHMGYRHKHNRHVGSTGDLNLKGDTQGEEGGGMRTHSRRRHFGSTQATAYTRHVAQEAKNRSLEEAAELLESMCDEEGNTQDVYASPEGQEEAWRKYYLDHYEYYGYYPGGAPHCTGHADPNPSHSPWRSLETRVSPYGEIKPDEDGYVRVPVQLLQRYQQLEWAEWQRRYFGN